MLVVAKTLGIRGVFRPGSGWIVELLRVSVAFDWVGLQG